MNLISTLIGILAIGLGGYTAILHKKSPEKLGKLGAMKKFWGEKNGSIIHFIFYSIIPVAFGFYVIVKGFTIF